MDTFEIYSFTFAFYFVTFPISARILPHSLYQSHSLPSGIVGFCVSASDDFLISSDLTSRDRSAGAWFDLTLKARLG